MPDNDRLRSAAARIARIREVRERESDVAPPAFGIGFDPDALDQLELVRRDKLRFLSAPKLSTAVELTFSDAGLDELVAEQSLALEGMFNTLEGVVLDLDVNGFFSGVPDPLPDTLTGTLLGPDGAPVERVAVTVERPSYEEGEVDEEVAWPHPRAITDSRGRFRLDLPVVPAPAAGLTLRVRGRDRTVTLTMRRADVLSGRLGDVVLEQGAPQPLAQSIMAALADTVPTDERDPVDNPLDFARPERPIQLGEGDCARAFRAGSGVINRFPFQVLVRLIEPQVTPPQLVAQPMDDSGHWTPVDPDGLWCATGWGLDARHGVDYLSSLGNIRPVDRLPVTKPIDVTDFHTDLEQRPARVPKASTLGLGYVLNLAQVWVPAGLSLGDLVYSLPLAPGEEQQVSVIERRATQQVRDEERFGAAEQQRFAETTDSSTDAVFNSALRTASEGGSEMRTTSSSRSFGGGLGVLGAVGSFVGAVGVGGGYGQSKSSGETSTWQNTSRDYASSASERLQSAVSRSALASRRSDRVAVRMATAEESQEVTTKRISNHNRCHALTVQYWEVLRHYSIKTRVEDVQLVCAVPLEPVSWIQDSGEPLTKDPDRDALLARYRMVLRYVDVLEEALADRPDLRYGLELLRDLQADPSAEVSSAHEADGDVLHIRVDGTFLPTDEVSVVVVGRSGRRFGPRHLVADNGDLDLSEAGASSQDELVAWLRDQRGGEQSWARAGQVDLPAWMSRSDVARIELRRRTRPLSLDLADEEQMERLERLAGIGLTSAVAERLLDRLRVRLSRAEVDRLVGPPLIWDVTAEYEVGNDEIVGAFPGREAAVPLTRTRGLVTRRAGPRLSWSEVLRIEAAFQHVVRNSVEYSKAVWAALTTEERAMMLERFTIGVPPGGLVDTSHEIPLLNCVSNEVLGFFGNAMIMPFHIPPQLAEAREDRPGVSNRDVQDALLKFHRQGFAAPQGHVTLPTQGMLGESVLGSCTSCEKIDLTRFWNWQDSPIPASTAAAPDAGDRQPTMEAPSATQPSSMVSINSSGAQPTSALADLVKAATQQAEAGDFTGLEKLAEQLGESRGAAKDAHDTAIKAGTDLAKALISGVTDLSSLQKDSDDDEDEDGNGDESNGEPGGGNSGGGSGGGGSGGGGSGGGGSGGGGSGGGGSGGGGSGGGGSGGGGSGGGNPGGGNSGGGGGDG